MDNELKPPGLTMDKIKQSIKEIDRADAYAKKLQRAGFDLGTRLETNKDLRKKYLGLRDVFFPGQSIG